MTLSVVMAVRNGAPHVRAAIDSVLAQSVTADEFLIVDDASSDDTPRILSEYRRQDARIRVLRNETTLGPYPSANRGLAHARGDVIARHDADDVSPPDRFAIQLDALDPDVALVTGAVERFEQDDRPLDVTRPPSWQPRLEWELLFTNVVGAGAHVMFPRVFRGTPVRFAAGHRYAEDYGLWCTLSRLGCVRCPAQVVYRYRRHALSITSLSKREQHACLSEIRHREQAQYMNSDLTRDAADAVSRFWLADGPRVQTVPATCAVLAELRSFFLRYVEARYGPADRAALDAAIDLTLSDRLGYWLYRSIGFRDAAACRDLLSAAARRREAVHVSCKALACATGAVRRKLRARLP